jgi:hypothetical protein
MGDTNTLVAVIQNQAAGHVQHQTFYG